MWLLKTEGFQHGVGTPILVQVWADAVPPYAILSHRWSSDPLDEVSFSDVRHLSRASRSRQSDIDRSAILQKPGYDKLIKAITKACRDSWEYIWIDTCCIDKDSSVELSEAINSMYRYYEQAQVCYAYLADVTDDPESFGRSVYFTRGWTLQELLAPSYLIFNDKDWNDIGTKYSRCEAVSRCTGIAQEYLLGEASIFDASIAERMSWAASRKLSREEDVAYCLLGIFQVNMYQLYGEGKLRAFLRLQEEILKQSEDQSIFAWAKTDPSAVMYTNPGLEDKDKPHGMLADSPEDFKNSGNIKPYVTVEDMTPPVMTAKGLRMTLPLFPGHDNLTVAPLYCAMSTNGYDGFVAIYLRKLADRPNSYVRVKFDETLTATAAGLPQEVYVVQNMHDTSKQRIYPFHRLALTASMLQVSAQLDDQGHYSVMECDLGTAASGPRKGMLVTKNTLAWQYKANKQPGKLTAAIVLQYEHRDLTGDDFDMRSCVGLMFGLTSNFTMGWDVVEDPSSSDWYAQFSGRPFNRTVELAWHSVTVNLREEVKNGVKWSHVTLTMRPGAAVEDAIRMRLEFKPEPVMEAVRKHTWQLPFKIKKTLSEKMAKE